MFDQFQSDKPSFPYAKIATSLAVTAGICFGLCTAGVVVTSSSTFLSRFLTIPATICGVIVLLCLAGLIVLAIVYCFAKLIAVFTKKKED